MAPEMLRQKGYTAAVDLWALGIITHELLCRRHPFSGPTHYEMLVNIVSSPPVLAPKLSVTARHFVRQLLRKCPSKRLGCPNMDKSVEDGLLVVKEEVEEAAERIRSHPFLIDMVESWEAVSQRRLTVPFKPAVGRGEWDVSNFDACFVKETKFDQSVVEGASSAGSKSSSIGQSGSCHFSRFNFSAF
mmetsp:Transcript_4655/g.9091  ORF Transcript_4655/g.9091 Transcript_4655/m.9091 type:complete len:188 (+) Transcript_4655:2050-2613(+)